MTFENVVGIENKLKQPTTVITFMLYIDKNS